jgi:methylenetetrahydrofolate--tRNA-(uracil-5-)-methyltransferase
VRLGSLHRNTFLNSPRLLRPTLQLNGRPQTFIAGQLIGVEGYVESAAAGLLAAINASRLLQGRPCVIPPATTALGSLVQYITDQARRDFQPMNANYGLFPAIECRARGRERRPHLAARAARDLDTWMAVSGIDPSPPAAAGATALA